MNLIIEKLYIRLIIQLAFYSNRYELALDHLEDGSPEELQTINFALKSLDRDRGGGCLLRSGLAIERSVTGTRLLFNRVLHEATSSMKILSFGSDFTSEIGNSS